MAAQTFYIQLDAVVSNLVEMFPNDADFPTFKTFIGLLQKTNPSLVIQTFRENVGTPYEKQIDARDEKFLLDYKGVEYGSGVSDIVVKVKSYWEVLDAQTKDSLWQYMYILKELAKRA